MKIGGKRSSVKRAYKFSTIIMLAAVPYLLSDGWISVFTEMLIMGIAALGLNIMLGYAGMVNFGAAGFYGVGAYATALVMEKANLSFALGMLAGPLAAGCAGFVIGWFCIRLTHIYFALLTLAFSQIIFTIIFEWYSFTGGDNGIVGIEVPEIVSGIKSYYYLTLLILLFCLFITWKLVKSPFGRGLIAIRENAERSEFIGINTRHLRHGAFIASSVILGLAGSLYCGFSRSVFPEFANWVHGADIMVSCLLGGLYSFLGPVVGGAVFVLLEKLIVNFTEYHLMVTGFIIIAIVFFLRDGLVGFFADRNSER